ncbi:MAG: O-antigen ligase family protein [Candidatus Moranbacteria bacterium]|nr:O-antigen ligase family protein [Candidatus Moranbacteria bacterium]
MIKKYSQNLIETSTAIFIVAAVSIFIFANFIVGFSLPLYLFAVAFGFVLSVVYPRSGFYAIVFLTVIFERFFTLVPIYWNRAEYKIYPIDIIFAGVILGIIFQLIKNGLPRKLKIADYLVAVFIFAGAAYFIASAYLLRTDASIAFSTFKNYSFYGLFYFVVIFLFSDKERLLRLLKFFMAGAVVATIFIFIGIIRGEGLWTGFTPLSTPGTRILAFPHAFFFTMAVLVSLAWIAFRKDSYATFLKIMIPIWAIGIVGSLMRHLWISLFVSIIFIFFLLPKENRNRLKKIMFHYALIGVIAMIFLSYLSFLFPASDFSKTFASATGITGKRFVSTVQVTSDESLNWRKSVWQSTWREYKDNLIFGLGYGKKVSVEIGTKYKDFVEIRNIHNSLLTIFIQMGLWSALLFASLFWLLAKPLLMKVSRAFDPFDLQFLKIAFLAIFLNYLIAFLFQTYLETNLLGIFFWIILGGLAVLNSNTKIES